MSAESPTTFAELGYSANGKRCRRCVKPATVSLRMQARELAPAGKTATTHGSVSWAMCEPHAVEAFMKITNAMGGGS